MNLVKLKCTFGHWFCTSGNTNTDKCNISQIHGFSTLTVVRKWRKPWQPHYSEGLQEKSINVIETLWSRKNCVKPQQNYLCCKLDDYLISQSLLIEPLSHQLTDEPPSLPRAFQPKVENIVQSIMESQCRLKMPPYILFPLEFMYNWPTSKLKLISFHNENSKTLMQQIEKDTQERKHISCW